MIYIPTKQLILPREITDEGESGRLGKTGVAGFFTLKALSKFGTVRRERTFKNLITNGGLDMMFKSSQQACDYVHVGTGTTTPAFTDTSLNNYLDAHYRSSGTYGNEITPDYYVYNRITYLFAIGELGTNNLTEIGISKTDASGNLFSRALIVDGGGTPVAFPIQSDEQLEVTYELRFYPAAVDDVRDIVFNSDTYSVTTRAQAVTDAVTAWQAQGIGQSSPYGNPRTDECYAFDGPAGLITANNPTGSNLGQQSSQTQSSYADGNYYIDNACVWNTGTGNGNIRTIQVGGRYGKFQVEFDTAFTKTNVQTFTWNQRFSLARL